MQKLPLIEFELFHPSKITPWPGAEGNDPHLTGYQLSDGYICFNVGDHKLLEYSPEIRAHWGEVPVLADQMIGRVYIDLIDELNRFLEPIPEDLHWWMLSQQETPGMRWHTLCSYAWNETAAVDCSLLANRICDAFAGRTLQWECLVQSPDINIWASESEVFISWDNREKLVDGIPVWTASFGTQAFNRADFLAEMQDFRERYFDAMNRQLALVRAGALAPGVRTNVEGDEKDLAEDRAKPLARYVDAPHTHFDPTDWDAVRLALKQTLELTGLKLNQPVAVTPLLPSGS